MCYRSRDSILLATLFGHVVVLYNVRYDTGCATYPQIWQIASFIYLNKELTKKNELESVAKPSAVLQTPNFCGNMRKFCYRGKRGSAGVQFE